MAQNTSIKIHNKSALRYCLNIFFLEQQIASDIMNFTLIHIGHICIYNAQLTTILTRSTLLILNSFDMLIKLRHVHGLFSFISDRFLNHNLIILELSAFLWKT